MASLSPVCPTSVLLCRWLVLAMAMIRFYVQKGTHKGLYRSIARTLKFFQTFALVEVRSTPTRAYHRCHLETRCYHTAYLVIQRVQFLEVCVCHIRLYKTAVGGRRDVYVRLSDSTVKRNIQSRTRDRPDWEESTYL